MIENALTTYESMQPYKDGVIVSYTQPVPYRSARTTDSYLYWIHPTTGKTITVLYDNGDEVTYGYVGSFSKLPYTSVKKGDTLALMDEGAIYLMVKRDGVNIRCYRIASVSIWFGRMKFRFIRLLPLFLVFIVSGGISAYVLIFISLLLHEVGHLLAAKQTGMR